MCDVLKSARLIDKDLVLDAMHGDYRDIEVVENFPVVGETWQVVTFG